MNILVFAVSQSAHWTLTLIDCLLVVKQQPFRPKMQRRYEDVFCWHSVRRRQSACATLCQLSAQHTHCSCATQRMHRRVHQVGSGSRKFKAIRPGIMCRIFVIPGESSETKRKMEHGRTEDASMWVCVCVHRNVYVSECFPMGCLSSGNMYMCECVCVCAQTCSKAPKKNKFNVCSQWLYVATYICARGTSISIYNRRQHITTFVQFLVESTVRLWWNIAYIINLCAHRCINRLHIMFIISYKL